MEIIAFGAGAVVASIVWFFVYRNNQDKFKAAVDAYNKLKASVEAQAKATKDFIER